MIVIPITYVGNQVCGCCSSGTVNGANDCDLNGNCNCKEGYDPGNGCCSCLPGYYQSGFRGQCLGKDLALCNSYAHNIRMVVYVFTHTACGCCTSGTVNNADRCDGFGQCQCSLQFGGEKCCEGNYNLAFTNFIYYSFNFFPLL